MHMRHILKMIIKDCTTVMSIYYSNYILNIFLSHSTTLRYECIFMDQFIGTEIGVRLANNHVSSLPLDFGCSGFGSAANPYPLTQGSKPEPLKKKHIEASFYCYEVSMYQICQSGIRGTDL